MRQWYRVFKRPLQRRKPVTLYLSKSPFALGERFLFEHEFQSGALPSFRGNEASFVGLPQFFYPFAVVMMQMSKQFSLSPETLYPLLFLAVYTTDVSLSLTEARLFSGTTVMGCHCVRIALDLFKKFPTMPFYGTKDGENMRLLIYLLAPVSNSEELIIKEMKRSQLPIPGFILQLLLSVTSSFSAIAIIVECELEKYSLSGEGINHDFFSACFNGLLANDLFFLLLHFHDMHLILLNVVNHVRANFDYLSVQWTPLLNKLARIYMRQFQGDALAQLHFKLLKAMPALETKMPLTYFVRVLGSLVDAGVHKTDETSSLWSTVVDIATLAVKIHGSKPENLRSLWIPFFKAAVTFKPTALDYARVLAAYHVCASLGQPIILDKASFSQVARLICNAISELSLEQTSAAMSSFYIFLKEHQSISFFWVIDSLVSFLSEVWSVYGLKASAVVQDFIKNLEDNYFPSLHLSGVQLGDNPAIRPLLEKFSVVDKAVFWWRCGCGTQLPASAKKCLFCLRRRNASWTCVTCGAEHPSSGTEGGSCICGLASPRNLEAAQREIRLCTNCEGVLSSLNECQRCKEALYQKNTKWTCSFCATVCSLRDVCCSVCYTANPEKKPLLWRCDACDEYNQWTWSKCRRCPSKRRVGCVLIPWVSWGCGCGRRNHPSFRSCRTCSQASYGAYTCDSCGLLSVNHTICHLFIQSKRLCIAMCQHCGNVHPRDMNVLCSPFLPRQCHSCGMPYICADLPLKDHCSRCHVHLSYNELRPFRCKFCNVDRIQTGFHCASCWAPRSDMIQYDDVHVWKCNWETSYTSPVPYVDLCGRWNYSWMNQCRHCGEARGLSRYECRARFLPWQCSVCHSNNLPTDVVFCSHCSTGLQVAQECFICGLAHLSISCASGVLTNVFQSGETLLQQN